MIGRRGRLGFVLPSNNTVLEPETYSLLPAGFSAHFSRIISTGMDVQELVSMSAGADEAFGALAAGDMDCLAYACLSTSIAHGDGWDDDMTAAVTRATGIPCETAARATVRALHAVGAARVGLVTPYPDDLHEGVIETLGGTGIEVIRHVSMRIDDPLEVCRRSPAEVAGLAHSVFSADVDAVVIVATDLQTMEVVAQLEESLGVPVITTNQAMLWSTLSAVGDWEAIEGGGRLLEDPALRSAGRALWSSVRSTDPAALRDRPRS